MQGVSYNHNYTTGSSGTQGGVGTFGLLPASNTAVTFTKTSTLTTTANHNSSSSYKNNTPEEYIRNPTTTPPTTNIIGGGGGGIPYHRSITSAGSNNNIEHKKGKTNGSTTNELITNTNNTTPGTPSIPADMSIKASPLAVELSILSHHSTNHSSRRSHNYHNKTSPITTPRNGENVEPTKLLTHLMDDNNTTESMTPRYQANIIPRKVAETRITQSKGNHTMKGMTISIGPTPPLKSHHSNSFKTYGSNVSPVVFDWFATRELMAKSKDQGGFLVDLFNFELFGVPINKWTFVPLKTVGAGKSSGRTHRLFKAKVNSSQSVFIKVFPIDKWYDQFNLMDRFRGEWVTDGENFVMETAILSSLTKKQANIAPKLYCIGNVYSRGSSKDLSVADLYHPNRSRKPTITHVAIVTELFGEDLHSKLANYRIRYKQREQEQDREKMMRFLAKQRHVITNCARLLKKFHDYGFCHLDFTAENILVGVDPTRPNDVIYKLCDFGKSVVRETRYLRHTPNETSKIDEVHPFESCEPTIGKSYFIPPECIRILRNLDAEHIFNPVVTYAETMYPLDAYKGNVRNCRHDRAPRYFRADKADVYQLMVLCLVVSNFGESGNKTVYHRQTNNGQPIFNASILKRMKRLLPNNPLWHAQFVELVTVNTAQNPEKRGVMSTILYEIERIFRYIRRIEKERRKK